MSKVIEIIHDGGLFESPTYRILNKGLKPDEARDLCSIYTSRIPPRGKGLVVYLPVKDSWKIPP